MNLGTLIAKIKADTTGFKKGLTGAKKDIKSFQKTVGSSMQKAKTSSLMVAGAITAIGVASFKLGDVAGKYESIRDAFGSMTKEMGIGVEDFEKKVADASRGTLDRLTILQGGTRALSLIGREAFSDFGNQFAQMAALSKKAARATGQEVTFMFDSLITGMSRESKMILDNLGITVDLTQAKKDYAEELGKSTEELTISEEKTAVLNHTLEKLEETYGDVAVSGGGFAGAMSALKTSITNASIEIGTALLPALNHLVRILTPLIEEYIPKLIGRMKSIIDWLKQNEWAVYGLAGAIIGVLVPAFYALAVAIWTAMTPLLPFIAIGVAIGLAIWGIIEVVKILIKEWSKMVKIFEQLPGKEVVAWGVKMKKAFEDWIEETSKKVIKFFQTLPEKVKKGLEKLVGIMIDYNVRTLERWGTHLIELEEKIRVWFEELPGKVETWLITTGEAISAWWDETKLAIVNKLMEWGEAIKVWFEELPNRIKEWLSSIKAAFLTGWDEIKTNTVQKLTEIKEGIKLWFDNLLVSFKEWFTNLGKVTPKSIVEGYESERLSMAGKIVAYILGFIGLVLITLVVGFIDVAIKATTALRKKLIEGLEKVRAWAIKKIGEIVTGVYNKFLELPGLIRDAASKIKNALIQPFKNAWDSIKGWLDKINQGIKDALDKDTKGSLSIQQTLDETVAAVKNAYSELGNIALPSMSRTVTPAIAPVATATRGVVQHNKIGQVVIQEPMDIDTFMRRLSFDYRTRGDLG